MSGLRSIAALVTTGSLALVLATAPPAAADAPPAPQTRTVAGPGFAYARLAPPTQQQASSTEATAERAPAAAAFVPPANDDFVLRFAPDVSAGKRRIFEAAAGVWSSVLEVEVPITVSVSIESFSDPGILGGAAPTDLLADDPALPDTGTWYVSALANQFLGRDADPRRPEIDVVIAADYEFHEGLDPTVGTGGRISLLTLALHEMAHGLGHTTLAVRRPDGTGSVHYQGLPLAFDRRIADADRVPVVDLDPASLGRALTERLLWTGPEGVLADGGFLPELFAPVVFQPGSSVSHLDEATYRSELMTPFIAAGELRTTVPALTQAMMADSGWGLEVGTRAERLVQAMSRDFVTRYATPSEVRDLSTRLSTGTETRRSLARRYAYSDEWIATQIDGYYLTTLGRPADAAGTAHWTGVLRTGTPAATVAAGFFASSEHFVRSGGTNRAWVASLYRGVLRREPDRAGWDAWTAAADAGMPRLSIAVAFFQAPESRASRVRTLYRSLLGRDPDPDGLAIWTEVLRDGRDIDLAVALAASEEYESRAARRFG